MNQKVKIVLVQLGSPKSTNVSDVRSYLKEFLGDPRVVDINPTLWKIILNLFILPFRPYKSAKLYSRIWDGSGFPLIKITNDFTEKLSSSIGSNNIEVESCFLLSEPKYKDIWNKWEKEDPNTRASKWIIVPMFPQYAEATTASVMDMFFFEAQKRVVIPTFEFLTNFHTSKAFINSSAKIVNDFLGENQVDDLVISFHGIPLRRVLSKNDPYFKHCYETFELLKERINKIDTQKIHLTFQSRFGSEQWLGPYTDEYSVNLVENGSKKIAVYCPSFVADCLETVDEIGTELGEEIHEAGGKSYAIECLNSKDYWIESFGQLIKAKVEGQDQFENQLIKVNKEQTREIPVGQELKSPPLSAEAKSSIKIIFLTLFLDLVGFSIIFPLFPALAKHYLLVDAENFFLKAIFGSIETLTSVGGAGNFSSIVLFGGALGALYSLLQFIAAPIWGSISDRIGRRPVLIISVLGLAFSYLLWIFSGSFTLLILARFVGGIMGGNISTATAVVADVTQKENRAKGMAFVGIAFALGFIIGPAMGGILSMVDLTKIFPGSESFGVNPFSAPALLAFILSIFNVYYLIKKFKETLPPEKRGHSENDRSANPIKIFKPLPYAGVNLTNFGHFLFLMAFSGMEFTLTFLAVERLSFSSMDNAYMFIFIGFIIAMVQGGVVRRKASEIGEKKLAIIGLCTIIPGLLLIGIAKSILLLYGGLFFLAVGSSLAIPCLTSLVSLYTPPEYQGKSIGIFRSLGALARVIGPIFASIIYWQMGSSYPYMIGSVFMLIPILMTAKLPKHS